MALIARHIESQVELVCAICSREIVAKRLSVREAEKLVVRSTSGQDQKRGGRTKEKSRDITRLEEELSDALATTVNIQLGSRNKGELIISFANLDQLDGVIARLRQDLSSS